MDKLKNEQGYALVTVLLIIVIFMILFLSFTGQSFNNMKQNQIVEKSSKSTALAEMGVNYYRSFIQQMYESNQIDFNTNNSNNNKQLQQIIQQNIQNQTSSSAIIDSSIKQKITNLMATDIIQQVQNKWGIGQPYYPLVDNNNNPIKTESFTLNQISFTIDSNLKITFKYEIIGNDNGKPSTLDANITLDLSAINVNYLMPAFNSIVQPSGQCTNLSTCSQLSFNSSIDFSGNNNNLFNKTIFTTGSLSIDGNANNNNMVYLHAEGPITIGKNMNNASNLIVETKSSATFNGQLTVNSYTDSNGKQMPSKILVNQDLTVTSTNGNGNGNNGSHLKLTDNSFAYVGGNVNAERLTVDSSKMCVKGNVTVPTGQLSILNNGSLFVMGTVNNQTTYTVDQQTFNMNCGTPDLTSPVNWGSGIKAIITNVTYK